MTAKKLKSLREAASLTQVELAALCGFRSGASLISHWETGRRPIPEYAATLIGYILKPLKQGVK